MSLLNIVLCAATILLICEGCCSSNFLEECSCELDVDTTEFLIPRFASNTYPLERKYIREEVNKDSVIQWVKNYYHKEKIEGSFFWYYWEESKGKLKNQDRIFYYSIDLPFAGIEGLGIVRDCKIILKIPLSSVQL